MATTRALTVPTPKALMMPMAVTKKDAITKKVLEQYKKVPAQKKKKNKYWCYYPNMPRDSILPVCKIFLTFFIEG